MTLGFLGSTLVTLGELFIVIEGFLDQLSKVKCIHNVLRNTFWCEANKIFDIFQDHDANMPDPRSLPLSYPGDYCI